MKNGNKMKQKTKPQIEVVELKIDTTLFYDNLKIMLGKNTDGILTFCKSTTGKLHKWDVKLEKDKLFFGLDEMQNVFFPVRLMTIAENGCGGILRVFTNQKLGSLPVKEVYGFFMILDKDNFKMGFTPAAEVEQDINTDYQTGAKRKPEAGIVYCDLEGNKISSWDLN